MLSDSLWVGDKHFRSTYEIRFTSEGSEAYWITDDVTPIHVPFEVWNVTLGYQVLAEILDQDQNQIWEPTERDYIGIVDVPYDGNAHPEAFPYNHAWFFRLAITDTSFAPGDVFTVEGAPVNGADDIFAFRTDGVNITNAKSSLDKIRVVPDPYIVHASWETSKYERKLQFTHLPEICTIRIYTLSGDLVNTVEHSDGSGTADWNMLSRDGLDISPGVYLYHIESSVGSRTGRFALIK